MEDLLPAMVPALGSGSLLVALRVARKQRARAEGKHLVMTVPFATKSILGTCILVALVFFSFVLLDDVSSDGERLILICSALLLICLPTLGLFCCFRRRIDLTPGGLLSTDIFGRQTRIDWRQIYRVSWNMWDPGFRVRTAEGQSIKVDQWLAGQRDFATRVLKRVDRDLLECEGQLIMLADK